MAQRRGRKQRLGSDDRVEKTGACVKRLAFGGWTGTAPDMRCCRAEAADVVRWDLASEMVPFFILGIVLWFGLCMPWGRRFEMG